MNPSQGHCLDWSLVKLVLAWIGLWLDKSLFGPVLGWINLWLNWSLIGSILVGTNPYTSYYPVRDHICSIQWAHTKIVHDITIVIFMTLKHFWLLQCI